MTRVLLRAYRSPFRRVGAEEVLDRNLVGNNAGNLVFGQAVHRLLSTQDQEVTTSRLLRLRPGSVEERFDHVVVPLANAFRATFVPQLEQLTRFVERVDVPVSVVGVGAQASLSGREARPDEVAEVVTRFVRAVLERSPSIGVRGEHTRAYLERLGFGDEHVDVVGCPSMYWHGPDLRVEPGEPLTSGSRLALTVSPYLPAIAPIVRHHVERYPDLVYVAQDLHTLALMVRGTSTDPQAARRAEQDLPVTLDHPLLQQDRARFYLDPTTWSADLARRDFVLGTRIHGTIAALLGGTPAVVLAHDSRTLELARHHAIPHRRLDRVPADVDAATLHAEADWGPFHAGHPARWEAFRAFLGRHRLATVHDPGESPRAFDDALAAVDLAPPVRVGDPTSTSGARAWLRSRIPAASGLAHRVGDLARRTEDPRG